MGITLKMRREMVQVERDVIKGLREDQQRIRRALNQARLNIKMHQEILVSERKHVRAVREQKRIERMATRREKRDAQIAKMEARLLALKAAS